MRTMVAIPPTIEDQPETLPRPEVRTEVTPEELLAMPDGEHYELIDGQLRERNVSFSSDVIAGETLGLLRAHCRPRNLGWLPSAQLGFRCFPWKPRRVRRADVSFIRAERVTPDLWDAGYCTIPPDVAVEVVSPNDLASKDVEEKVDDYVRAGVKLVWVVYPATRTVYVIRGDGTGYRLRSEDELTGEEVIPGFRCRVADLFPAPSVGEAVASGQDAAGPEAPRP
jgi:Uma2 family endonuclease